MSMRLSKKKLQPIIIDILPVEELRFPWWPILHSVPDGLIIEFGCSSCTTFNEICDRVYPRIAYGFDWFYGLPEHWDEHNPKGSSSMNGEIPRVPRNGKIVVGLVEMSVPLFLQRHREPIAFVHFDMDLYSPTKFCLAQIADRLFDGSILAFDQVGSNAGKKNEQLAFLEFLSASNYDATIVGWRGYGQIAFRLKKSMRVRTNVKQVQVSALLGMGLLSFPSEKEIGG